RDARRLLVSQRGAGLFQIFESTFGFGGDQRASRRRPARRPSHAQKAVCRHTDAEIALPVHERHEPRLRRREGGQQPSVWYLICCTPLIPAADSRNCRMGRGNDTDFDIGAIGAACQAREGSFVSTEHVAPGELWPRGYDLPNSPLILSAIQPVAVVPPPG